MQEDYYDDIDHPNDDIDDEECFRSDKPAYYDSELDVGEDNYLDVKQMSEQDDFGEDEDFYQDQDELPFQDDFQDINTQLETIIDQSFNSIKKSNTPSLWNQSESQRKIVKLKHHPKSQQKTLSENSQFQPYLPGQLPKNKRNSKSKQKAKAKTPHQFLDHDLCTRAEILLKEQTPLPQIRKKLGISPRAMKKLYAQYQLYGKLIPTKGCQSSPRQTMQKLKEYSTVQQILKELIAKNCSITLKHMQKTLKQNGIYKSRSTIHSYLQRMRFSRKKLQKIPLQRNSQNKIEYRKSYCKMIQQIPLNKQIFLDQTIFGLQTAGHYGWAPKGQQPKVFIPASRRKHITLLAAISIRGFQATKIIKGPVTSKHVCQFLQHYLDHLQPDQILILDNARMHHSAVVKQKIKQLNRNVRYLPAYTPQLNPIQNIFSQIKCQYVRLKQDQDLKTQDMINLIQEAIKAMRSKEFSKYYQHYEQWLKRGIAEELFV